MAKDDKNKKAVDGFVTRFEKDLESKDNKVVQIGTRKPNETAHTFGNKANLSTSSDDDTDNVLTAKELEEKFLQEIALDAQNGTHKPVDQKKGAIEGAMEAKKPPPPSHI